MVSIQLVRLVPLACLLASAAVADAAAAGAAGSLYDELELEPTATPRHIRAAYHRLALKLHPDKKTDSSQSAKGGGWADSTARFIRVSEAYETLSNQRKRAAYDASLRSQPHTAGGGGSGTGGAAGQSAAFKFSFSLKDAFEVLERFMGGSLPSLGGKYALAKAALAKWPGFTVPLPELLSSGLLQRTIEQVDWAAIGGAVKGSLQRCAPRERSCVDACPLAHPLFTEDCRTQDLRRR